MDETEEFLAATMPRLHEVETALHSGDAGPRMAMWSREDPVTLFGAALVGTGWAEIGPIFQRLGASFSDCRAYENEIIAAGASGDLAYTVAYEHTTASLYGGAPTPYVLRVTTVFRREDGTWKVVHRHADPVASPGAGELVELLTSGPGGTVQADVG
jgi:ketosteroid isomerase-like protein